MFNDALLAKMKRGSYIVNTARGAICDRDAIVCRRPWRLVQPGRLRDGDVWFSPSLRRKTIPGGRCPTHGMTPHISGTTRFPPRPLTLCRRRARRFWNAWFAGRPIREEYLIVTMAGNWPGQERIPTARGAVKTAG